MRALIRKCDDREVSTILEVINDAATLESIHRIWPPRPWAAGQRNLHIGVRLEEVTGRRLGSGWDPVREATVRRIV